MEITNAINPRVWETEAGLSALTLRNESQTSLSWNVVPLTKKQKLNKGKFCHQKDVDCYVSLGTTKAVSRAVLVQALGPALGRMMQVGFC